VKIYILDVLEPLSLFILTGSLLLFVTAPTIYLIMRRRSRKKGTHTVSYRGQYLRDATPEFYMEALELYPQRTLWRFLEYNTMIWQLLGYGLASLGFVILNFWSLLPLILILLALLAAYFTYVLLGLLKPRPCLRLTPGHPVPGSPLNLEWWFPRRQENVTKLKLILRGFEKIKHDKSFNLNYKLENQFFEELLLETTCPEEISPGAMQLNFPDFVPMSFKTKNQEILWEIHVEWAASYWPDLKNDYTIQVAPGPMI